MQKVRGFVYFEKNSLKEIKSILGSFKFDKVKFSFFNSLFRYDRNISEVGVFIDGKVSEEYSSQDIVNIFRKQVGLEEKSRGCDLSIESEDTLKSITSGDLTGQYIGIRIKPPYELNQIYKLASKIETIVESSNTFVRTVESKNNEPSVCIDLITQKNYQKYKNQNEDIINSNNLNLGKYTFIKLE